MLEALASSGSKTQVDFPDSGPGSQRLQFGTDKLGYFASVAPTNFFSAYELRKQLNFQIGTDNNNDALNWVKAFFNKKVIFFPQFPFATGVTWNQLYAAGLVYGVDGPGNYPAGSGSVNQLKLVSIGKDVFKVRLFAISQPAEVDDGYWNRSSTALIAGNISWLSNSEWSSMCQSLIQGVSSNYAGPKWGIYPSNSFLALGRTAVMKESCSDTTYATTGSNTQIAGALKTTGGWWYPVLELVPASERPLLAVNELYSKAGNGFDPIVTNEIVQDVGLVRYRERYSQVISAGANPVVDDITYAPLLNIQRSTVQVQTTEQHQPVIDDITYL